MRSKLRFIIPIGVCLVVLAAIVGVPLLRSHSDPGATILVLGHAGVASSDTESVSASGDSPATRTSDAPATTAFNLETVSEQADLVRGLGGRSSLAANSGLLMEYESFEQHCIWMKDMQFAIDVIWLDNDKRITSIVPNMKPESYPQSYCAKSRYVIELNSGSVANHGVRLGQTLAF